MLLHHRLELVELIGEVLDLISDFQHLHLVPLHNFVPQQLVFSIHRLHRVLDYICGKCTELGLYVVTDRKFAHKSLESLMHLSDVHTYLIA